MAEPLLLVSLDAIDDDLAVRYEAVDEWYVGEYTDHVYATCPALRRSARPLRRGSGKLYPEAGDVCGTCLRWWRARKVKQDGAHAEP